MKGLQMTQLNMKCPALAVMAFCVMALFSPTKSFANTQDWAFVQSVGGMRVDQPRQSSVEWTLPVEVDITGLHAITTQPTAEHPDLICQGIGADIENNNIYLALFTATPWIGAKNGQCPPVSLGHPMPGRYTVYYSGRSETPVKLTEIFIEP